MNDLIGGLIYLGQVANSTILGRLYIIFKHNFFSQTYEEHGKVLPPYLVVKGEIRGTLLVIVGKCLMSLGFYEGD